MGRSFRHPEILDIARRDGRVTVEGLAAHFGVALQTVRRDLADLEAEGALERVHGGAVPARAGQGAPTALPRPAATPSAAPDILTALAAACAAAVPEGASVFLGAGPGPEAAARALAPRSDLLIITNALPAAAILSAGAGCALTVLGGEAQRGGALAGALTLEALESYKTDLAVIGCAALDRDGDVLEAEMRLAVVHRAAMARARRTALICESARILRSAPARVGSLRDLHALYTDRRPPPALAALCTQADVRIELPGPRIAA